MDESRHSRPLVGVIGDSLGDTEGAFAVHGPMVWNSLPISRTFALVNSAGTNFINYLLQG